MRIAMAFAAGIAVGAAALWVLAVPHADKAVLAKSATKFSVAAAPAPNPLLGKWNGPYSNCSMTFTATTWSDACAGTGSESRRVSGYQIDGATVTVAFPSSDTLDVYHMVDANTVTFDSLGDKATLHRAR
jgi:hypothetical protein